MHTEIFTTTCINGCINGCTNGCINGCINGCVKKKNEFSVSCIVGMICNGTITVSIILMYVSNLVSNKDGIEPQNVDRRNRTKI